MAITAASATGAARRAGLAAGDAELAVAAGAGDRLAFEALARRWWERIARYAAAATGGDRELAEEVAQDSLVRLHASLPGFRGEAALGTFLYRIVRNAAVDAIRRRARERRRQAPLGKAAEDTLASAHRGPEEAAIREETRAAVGAAMERLGEAERSLVYLREAEGLGIAELARVFSLPEGTVKSRLFRARTRLGALLKEAGYAVE